jgi:hypothetical protein
MNVASKRRNNVSRDQCMYIQHYTSEVQTAAVRCVWSPVCVRSEAAQPVRWSIDYVKATVLLPVVLELLSDWIYM